MSYRGIVSRGKEKVEGDFYATPPQLIEAFLKQHELIGEIWEPCCGSGFISEVVKKQGYDIKSTDLFDRGYGETGIDFFNENRSVDTVFTNPPFGKIDLFLEHAKKQARKHIIIITSNSYIYNKKRSNILRDSSVFGLKTIYAPPAKLSYWTNGVRPEKKTGFMGTLICVFEKGFSGATEFKFLDTE